MTYCSTRGRDAVVLWGLGCYGSCRASAWAAQSQWVLFSNTGAGDVRPGVCRLGLLRGKKENPCCASSLTWTFSGQLWVFFEEASLRALPSSLYSVLVCLCPNSPLQEDVSLRLESTNLVLSPGSLHARLCSLDSKLRQMRTH